MNRFLSSTRIYDDEALQSFILSLENEYLIEDGYNEFGKLVNYSMNNGTPFHGWFRYREGFSGKLIEKILSISGALKNEIIIDPFSGSGTTPVTASLNGYHVLGVDVNPISALITSVKLQSYSSNDIAHAWNTLEQVNYDVITADEDKYEDIRKYFNSDLFNGLLHIKSFIDGIINEKIKNLFLVAFICIIEDCSNRRRDGNGLKTVKTKVVNVNDIFHQKLTQILDDIKHIKPNEEVKVNVATDTAFNLFDIYNRSNRNIQTSTGAIIFSPPYPNSFDYFESYKLELVFGGFVSGIQGIKQLRSKAVRSFIGMKSQNDSDPIIDKIAIEIENAIPQKEQETGKKDSRTRKVPNMLRGYFYDMQEIIRQCGLCLESGKKTFIVVDQSSYLGKPVPTDLLLAYLSEKVGFRVGRIIVCRNAKTSVQQQKKYPFLMNTLRESIVELIKT